MMNSADSDSDCAAHFATSMGVRQAAGTAVHLDILDVVDIQVLEEVARLDKALAGKSREGMLQALLVQGTDQVDTVLVVVDMCQGSQQGDTLQVDTFQLGVFQVDSDLLQCDGVRVYVHAL